METPKLIELEHLRARPTTKADLDFVRATEQDEANTPFIGSWTREQHAATFAAPETGHFVLETLADNQLIGYFIMMDLTSPDECLQLRRIAIAEGEKGKGYGLQALRLIKKLAFEEYGAHLLWLDVMEFNQRARHLYASEGFIIEGTLRDRAKYPDGFRSLVIMSILRDEYEKL